MSDNYIVINGKETEITRGNLQTLEIEKGNKSKKNKDNKRWRAHTNGDYFYVLPFSLSVGSTTEYKQNTDDNLYYSHNYFKTYEEAEKYAKVLQTEILLKKFADENNDKFTESEYPSFEYSGNLKEYYYIRLSVDDYEGFIDGLWIDVDDCPQARIIRFSSKEVAKQAIEEIGEEHIKEYLSYEW